jgi:hypothetical protein
LAENFAVLRAFRKYLLFSRFQKALAKPEEETRLTGMQRGPRYDATEPPLHRNGAAVVPKRGRHCKATGASLPEKGMQTVAEETGNSA